MTIKAIRQFLRGDTRLHMAFQDSLRLVVVTAIAGKFGVCLSVADLAILITLSTMVEREGMDFQIGRCPGLSRVAIFAL